MNSRSARMWVRLGNQAPSITLISRNVAMTERHVMANAQYWREQVARLHRDADARHNRRLPQERVPLRLRLRKNLTTADCLRPTYDPVGKSTAMTAGTPRWRSS